MNEWSFWAGLSADLVMEQDMCSLKTSDDLTRGRGNKTCLKTPFSKNLYHLETSFIFLISIWFKFLLKPISNLTKVYFLKIIEKIQPEIVRMYLQNLKKVAKNINTFTLKEHHLSTSWTNIVPKSTLKCYLINSSKTRK